jgi:hypothetical protein
MLIFTLFSLAALLQSAQSNTCYSVDGQVLDDTYKPCNPSAQFSACCALNGTSPDNDICLDSGLCQSTSGWFAGFIWADGCTDPTGKSNYCPQICSHMPLQYSWNVLQCNPGVFCCRPAYEKSNCCNDTSALVNTSHIGTLLLPDGEEVNTTYVAPASSSCPSRSRFPSAGAVGGAVGGVLGTALLVALTTIILLLRRRKALTHDLDTKTTELNAAYEHQQVLKEKMDISPPYPSTLVQQPFYGQQGQVYFNQGALGGTPQGMSFAQNRSYEMDGLTPSEMDGLMPSEMDVSVRSGPGGYHQMGDEGQSESTEPKK